MLDSFHSCVGIYSHNMLQILYMFDSCLFCPDLFYQDISIVIISVSDNLDIVSISSHVSICLSVNAGCFGRGRSIVSLLSMEITMEIVGLSLENSCTHSSPICMHLKISISKHGSRIIGSINATILSAFHIFHAYRKQKHENKIENLSINTKNSSKQAMGILKKNEAMRSERLTNPRRLMFCSS
jgi:hypothetical protein